eukprot:gene28724-32101_t
MSQGGIIGIDWGSTGFRAYRFGAGGTVVETRSSVRGIKTVEIGSDREAAFAGVLTAELGDWLAAGPRVVLSGMITSRNGWVETPYIHVPARE